MTRIPQDYIERCYAGWLGKIIGVRLGAPVEGWTYERIRQTYGELTHYPQQYNDFAADDDTNGPLFYLRALEQVAPGERLTAQHVAQALLNFAPRLHGFFWWGGYGVSTEHTAYLNLYHGIPAPRSGSIAQNGATVAEQIGGQIFIDSWGLVSPGNPKQAARLAREAASVTHDGNGIYGGIFIAVCIALAFELRDASDIVECALNYIPEDCEYTRVVHAVMDYHCQHPDNWHDCFAYIHANFGYDKYPGNCHIIPNSAVIVMALLYGNNSFTDTINICNMAGWDTDCNVGNAGTIMGVMCGLDGMNLPKWQPEIHDMLVCSSVLGSLNVMDIPYGASYMAAMGYRLAGQQPPAPWAHIFEHAMDSCHFEYPTSTHNLRVRRGTEAKVFLENTGEAAFTGRRSLKVVAQAMQTGESIYLYKRTYSRPQDFDDSRYDPEFSPLIYPGQTVNLSVMNNTLDSGELEVRLYARTVLKEELIAGDSAQLTPGTWQTLTLQLPPGEDIIREVGVQFTLRRPDCDVSLYVDDLIFSGTPDYRILIAQQVTERWRTGRTQVSQFTRWTGLAYLADNALHVSGADTAEVYTGGWDWRDIAASARVHLVAGQQAALLFRVQGAQRSYAFGFTGHCTVALMKKEGAWRILSEQPFAAEPGREYELHIETRGATLTGTVDGVTVSFIDENNPWLYGCVGLLAHESSHVACAEMTVKELPTA